MADPVIVWTAEHVAALQAAIASGVKRVTYEGPPRLEREYQDLAEMRSLLASIVGQVSGAPSTYLVSFRKGFE